MPKTPKTFFGKIWAGIGRFFAAIGRGIGRIVAVLGLTFEKVFRGIFAVLKLFVRAAVKVLFAVAALILAAGAAVWLVSRGLGLPDSEPFREARDFWILAASEASFAAWTEDFAEDQARLPDGEKFAGALPTIGAPTGENRAAMRAVVKYCAEWER